MRVPDSSMVCRKSCDLLSKIDPDIELGPLSLTFAIKV
jgi:hypothetical protein